MSFKEHLQPLRLRYLSFQCIALSLHVLFRSYLPSPGLTKFTSLLRDSKPLDNEARSIFLIRTRYPRRQLYRSQHLTVHNLGAASISRPDLYSSTLTPRLSTTTSISHLQHTTPKSHLRSLNAESHVVLDSTLTSLDIRSQHTIASSYASVHYIVHFAASIYHRSEFLLSSPFRQST